MSARKAATRTRKPTDKELLDWAESLAKAKRREADEVRDVNLQTARHLEAEAFGLEQTAVSIRSHIARGRSSETPSADAALEGALKDMDEVIWPFHDPSTIRLRWNRVRGEIVRMCSGRAEDVTNREETK